MAGVALQSHSAEGPTAQHTHSLERLERHDTLALHEALFLEFFGISLDTLGISPDALGISPDALVIHGYFPGGQTKQVQGVRARPKLVHRIAPRITHQLKVGSTSINDLVPTIAVSLDRTIESQRIRSQP